jgi:hypothetical protein
VYHRGFTVFFILTSESTRSPGPLVGPDVKIQKRWNLHNEPKRRFVDVPTKTELQTNLGTCPGVGLWVYYKSHCTTGWFSIIFSWAKKKFLAPDWLPASWSELWKSMHNLEKRSSENLAVQRGVVGRAWAMRAIAPNTPPHVYPRQGRRSLTPRLYATSVGGITAVELCASAATKLRITTRTRRRYTAARATTLLCK